MNWFMVRSPRALFEGFFYSLSLQGMKRILLLLLFCGQYSWAQIDSLAVIQLEEVELKSIQLTTPIEQFPAAIYKKEISALWQGSQSSLQEYIEDLPGLISFNRSNYAQDLRISIRGFGSRAAFGIRGIKLIVDGIPETTPDGQGQLDNLPLGILSSIEILRGPSAVRYGNAAGGVLAINTLEGVEEDFHQIGLRIGSYGAQQAQYTAGLKKDKTTAIFHLNHSKAKGYRDNSQFENNMFNTKVRHHFSPTLHAMLQFNATKSPYAQDAGGQTIEEFNNNRRSARDRNLQYKTGEKIAHYKSGATISYQKGKVEGALYGFIAKRNFEGKLPFANGGWVDLNRRNTGQGGSFSFSNKEQKLGFKTQLSYDIATQGDLRKRFVNSEGLKGELTLDQKESFNSFGVALIQHLTYGPMVFNGGLRWDANELKVDDYFLNDGNDTAAITLNAWSPQVGISYTFFPGLSGFGNLSKSYETPTLSELSANPNGNGGFNPLIDIQVAENLEWGVHFTAKKTKGSLVYFNINTTNDLVAYELADSPGRTFYQNAGSTKREGIELLLQHQFSHRLSANLTFNSASFTYKNFEQNGENYAGNKLPGIPKNFGVLRLTYQWKNGPLINYSKTYRSDLYADNNNATRVDSFYRDDINLSIPLNKINDRTAVFLGCNNLFNSLYSDNIRINAFGGRYYEAAPEREIYVNLQWQF
jgi:iron complex outermembrane receptor protein